MTVTKGIVRPSLGLALLTLFVFGFGYAWLATMIGKAWFPDEANGSLLVQDGKIVGSLWVAQPFAADRYFHSRPSASNFDVMALSGSNQALSNPGLRLRVHKERAAIADREGSVPLEAVPSDLVTQSASGVDPHISPQAAYIQIKRVARIRDLDSAEVEALVSTYTEPAQWGLFGQARVNVLALNLALDRYANKKN